MTKSLEGHADQRFDGDLNTLHLLILEMGGLVMNQCQLAVDSLTQQDLSIAQSVLGRQPKINSMDESIENRVVELIGRHSPISKDLRITLAFSKIVVDLERIGDEAARIAHIVGIIHDGNQPKPGKHQMRDVISMGALALSLLDSALSAFDKLDAKLAESQLNSEQELDAEFQSSLRHLTTFVLEDPRNLGHSINLTLVLKAMERIGAHARNISEYVIYLVHGVNIRYQRRATDKRIDH